jgi:DNA polymerase-3 subunit gamma/tau
MPALGKSWQILLKGIGEVQTAPNPSAAAEMILIRLSYASTLPDPADLIRKLKDGSFEPDAQKKTESVGGPPGGPALYAVPSAPIQRGSALLAPQEAPPVLLAENPLPANLSTLPDIIAFLEDAGEVLLAGRMYQYVHLVRIEDKDDSGLLEFRPAPEAPQTLPQSIRETLSKLSGKRWMVSVSSNAGEATLSEQNQARLSAQLAAVKAHPLVQDVFKLFPGAEIIDIKKA